MSLPRLALRILLGRRLPITSGELRVAGISRPVLIRRDRFGVPYIQGETDDDAWYGLGFCQGQDRAFQLEVLQRTVRGTLAELVGAAGLPVDRLSRRIGFHRAAGGQVEVLDPEIRQMLEAFAQGVTDGARLGSRKPAHEFALLRARPTAYQPVDILAFSKYVAFGLSTWTAKLSRLILLRRDGPQALQALDANYADWLPASRPIAAPAGPALERLGEDLAQLAGMVGTGGASNAWAVAASSTATGRPLLANDPHLTPSIPAPWYLAHVRTPDWTLAGAFFIGSPVVGAGHNGVAAWGATAGMADNLDLYLEELGDDGRTVRDGDQFMFCEIWRETIRVKGQEPVEEDVLVTPRGPIISDVLEGELGAISMRATWMAPRPLRGLLQVYRAASFEEFRQAMADWPAASFGLVYADTSDTIGWQLTGLVPQRGGAWGRLPLPGWVGETQWKPQPIPFGQMPYVANPESGFVATANNKPIRDGDGPYLGTDWSDGYRLARIVEVLGSRNDWDLGAMQRLQMDQVSVPWREMRDAVLAVAVKSAEGQEALALLARWDGIVTAESPAAAVYEFFLAEMLRSMAQATAPNSVAWAMGRGFHPLLLRSSFGTYGLSHLVRLLREQPDGWFQAPWPEQVARALTEAVRQLKTEYGPSPAAWGWGRIRPLTLSHPLSTRPPLDRVFNRGPFPQGGDSQTLAQTGRLFRDVKANPPVIANLRMVVDVGNWEENLFVLAGGQSGNPLSPHYDDQLALWMRGEGLTIAWSEEAIGRVTQSTLRLSLP